MMDDVCSRWGWIVWGENGFRTLKIWFLASATASNRLLHDANRLLGLENVILAPGTASNRLLSSANRLLTVCRNSENGFDRIFQTVSPFQSPFEALGSLLNVFFYNEEFGISGRLNYVGSSKTYGFVEFCGM